MNKLTELERLKNDRAIDTGWLRKYKKIVDGLLQIAEIQTDAYNNDFDEWATISYGLTALSKLLRGDIDGRKEAQ